MLRKFYNYNVYAYQFYETYEFENLAAFANENLKSFKAALRQRFCTLQHQESLQNFTIGAFLKY